MDVRVNKSAESGIELRSRSMLLADTNGDILFTQSLAVTLRLVRERLGTQTGAGGLFGKRLLIVGRRTDFTFSRWARNLSSSDSCELSRTLVHVAKEGEMMLPWACDYFLAVPGTFDWDSERSWMPLQPALPLTDPTSLLAKQSFPITSSGMSPTIKQ